MAIAKQGDKVNVHYTGKLNDGSIFDTSQDRDPLQFTIGSGEVIPGFEEAIVGMNPGDSKTVTIESGQAYGDHREEMVVEVARDQIPENIQPEVGLQLQIDREDGQITVVTVMEMNDSTVTLDANHPLAGKDLTFELELVDIA